jgi:hypothetical protein
MAARKAFPLRLAPDLYEEIRRWADSEFRSVNSQIEFILRRAVRERRGRPPDDPSPPGDGPGEGRKPPVDGGD